METVTYKSHDARLKWREMMDAALVGKQVVIERYDTPQAVLVNYEHWSMFQQAFLAMLQERSREVTAGKFVPFEEVEADLRAQGII
jgi:PHD/YefM family antitoxin component YafN of YafNO toxin-antitoxin module